MSLAPPSDAPGAIDGQYRRLSLLLHQTILIDYLGGTNPRIIGWAEPGSDTVAGRASPIWKIAFLAFDLNNNVTNVDWAMGTMSYSNVWDNRGSLSSS